MWNKADLKQLVTEKLLAYEREHRKLDMVLFDQVESWVRHRPSACEAWLNCTLMQCEQMM